MSRKAASKVIVTPGAGRSVLAGTQKAVLAGDLLGEGRDEAFAIDGDAEGGVDTVEEVGDVEGGAF
jgi:hypothetical protein